jgi:hypothetical protein
MNSCPHCQCSLYVREGKTELINDNTPDKPTEVYLIQEQFCHNPQCEYGKQNITVNTIRHRIV